MFYFRADKEAKRKGKEAEREKKKMDRELQKEKLQSVCDIILFIAVVTA